MKEKLCHFALATHVIHAAMCMHIACSIHVCSALKVHAHCLHIVSRDKNSTFFFKFNFNCVTRVDTHTFALYCVVYYKHAPDCRACGLNIYRRTRTCNTHAYPCPVLQAHCEKRVPAA